MDVRSATYFKTASSVVSHGPLTILLGLANSLVIVLLIQKVAFSFKV